MPTLLTAFGECKTLREWTFDARCVVSLATLLTRVRGGWEPERALCEPSASPADRWRQPIVAFGESKSLLEWEQDSRAKADAKEILGRLRRGWMPEEAISTPGDPPASRQKAEPRLYHGKSLSEWMNDPRCQVSRYTLERNLRARMPIEQALVFRKRRRRSAEKVQTISSVEQALALMAQGGELWQYIGGDSPRVSILHDSQRLVLDQALFDQLVNGGLVHRLSSAGTASEYGLTGEGLRRQSGS